MDYSTQQEAEAVPLLRQQKQAELQSTTVYPVIQQIREDAILYIDTPLSYDALTAPDLTYTFVRPLTEKYGKMRNMAVPFCLLLNRAHFLRDTNIATRSVSLSRAELCEIIAIGVLRQWADSTLDLAIVMTTSWLIFSGADPLVKSKVEEESEEPIDINHRLGNAIEMAIISDAKRFIKSSASQKVINGIWSGKIVYQPESDHAILSDTYKRAPIHFYNPMKAPLLDHYRLKVPAIRSVLEYLNFVILFFLFILVLETNEIDRINIPEIGFIIYAFGFTLDKLASMQEHGMKLYSANLWNGFDLAFILTFLPYVTLRLLGARKGELWALELGIDILAVAACFMFPRLAFVSLSNNLMVLSLRSMFVEFAKLMALAIFCFAGFLYALWTFGKSKYSAAQIAWWLADLWFGLDASGFDKASTFHPVFGPPLMAVYACCSNTLLLTVLVSILSHTFTSISSDAAAESMFRKAVSTIEGVKADALFSYQPPLNVFAFLVMWPMSFILSARWFHKVNVLMIRVTAFPILLAIGIYERQSRPTPQGVIERVSSAFDWFPRRLRPLTFFDGISGKGSDIDAIFEIEAKVVDDELNVHPPQTNNGHSLAMTPKPSILPSHSQSSPASNQMTPPLHIPETTTSPSSTSIIHEQLQTPSPGEISPFSPSDTASSAVIGDVEEGPDTYPQGVRLIRPAIRPLPPRHVRTRRDSMAHRAAVAAVNGHNGMSMNPSISSVLEVDTASTHSPLGQLFGTVVIEEEDPLSAGGGSQTQFGRALSLTRRQRTFSTPTAVSENGASRRRLSANIPQRPKFAEEEFPQPKSAQEVRSEEEEDWSTVKGEGNKIERMLREVEQRQLRMETQLEQLLTAMRR